MIPLLYHYFTGSLLLHRQTLRAEGVEVCARAEEVVADEQVKFRAVAPLDSREECAVSLTGDTRKLLVVGNTPELGGW